MGEIYAALRKMHQRRSLHGVNMEVFPGICDGDNGHHSNINVCSSSSNPSVIVFVHTKLLTNFKTNYPEN